MLGGAPAGSSDNRIGYGHDDDYTYQGCLPFLDHLGLHHLYHPSAEIWAQSKAPHSQPPLYITDTYRPAIKSWMAEVN